MEVVLSHKPRRRGRIDEFPDLETMDIIALNGGVNPYGPGDRFAEGGFKLGREFFRDFIEKWGFVDLEAVADVGCGFGRWSIFLAEVNKRVSGFDKNTNCVDLARKLTDHLALDNAHFRVADTSRIPASDESFGGVWCFNALSYVDCGSALREMRRILCPGGRAFLGHYYGAGLMLESFINAFGRGGLGHPAAERALNGLIEGPFFDGCGSYGSAEHMAEALDRHGFDLATAPPMYVHRTGNARREDYPRFTELDDVSALAKRLSNDESFAREFASHPEVVTLYPMHLDLVAIKRS